MPFLAAFEKAADVKTLGKVYSKVRSGPKGLALYNTVVRNAKRYQGTIDGVQRAATSVSQGRGSLDHIAAADRNRKHSHDFFMKNLRELASHGKRLGVDTKKLAPALEDRDKASDLALEISKRFRPIQKG
jgi:hypothetical protein